MDDSLRPTVPLNSALTVAHATDEYQIPASALAQDAAARGAVPFRAAPVEEVALAADDERLLAARLEGYRFVTCLDRSALGELWRVRTPKRQLRLARLLHGSLTDLPGDALARLARITHPALPATEVIHSRSGQTALVCADHDGTFADWAADCRARGLPGIPRAELVPALKAAARALDELYRQHRVQHLGLTPAALWIQDGRVLLGGFGLVELLGIPAGHAPASVNPRYSAPELFGGLLAARSDQYSLALVYAELVSGRHPLRLPRMTRLAAARGDARPDFDLVPADDRPVLLRALAPDPSRRFPGVPAFVCALEGATQKDGPPDEPLGPLLALGDGPGFASVAEFVCELVRLAAGPMLLGENPEVRYRLEPGRSLRQEWYTTLMAATTPLRLAEFCREWEAETALSDCGLYVLKVRARPTLWQRLIGRSLGLEMQVQLIPPAVRPRSMRSQVHVVIRPYGCGQRQAERLLREVGPALLAGLREHLGAGPEQRAQERLPLGGPVCVRPVVGGAAAREGIECPGKDVSRGGIGFFLPRPLSAPYVYVSYPESTLASAAALAQVVRGHAGPDGWYEVGARFAVE